MNIFSEQRNLKAKLAAIDRSQAMIEFAMDGTILSANELFLKTMRYSLDEVIGRHHSMFVPPEERNSQEYRAFWETLRSGRYLSAEYRRVAKDGSDVWISGSYNPLLDRRGVPYRVMKCATDITGEMHRRDRLALLSLVADGVDNSVVITDANGLIEYTNPGFTRLTGHTFEEARGRKPGSLVQGSGTDRATVAFIRQKLAAGQPLYQEILNYSKSGEPYWISLSVNPIRDSSGRVVRFVSVQTNITETKLRANEFFARLTAIEQVNAVLEWDSYGVLQRVNETGLGVLGARNLEQAATMPCVRYDQLFSSAQRADLSTGKSLMIELELSRNDRERIHLSSTIQGLLDEDGKLRRTVLYGIDVTRRRAAVRAAETLMSDVLERVSQVAEEISKTSFQTDLLALNATIEAAHAGEAGMGFAVVAGEVRALSSRSSVSTTEISTLVSDTRVRIEELRKAS